MEVKQPLTDSERWELALLTAALTGAALQPPPLKERQALGEGATAASSGLARGPQGLYLTDKGASRILELVAKATSCL